MPSASEACTRRPTRGTGGYLLSRLEVGHRGAALKGGEVSAPHKWLRWHAKATCRFSTLHHGPSSTAALLLPRTTPHVHTRTQRRVPRISQVQHGGAQR